MGRLDGKTGIVTGAASGIGRVTALVLAREGAQVVVADINVDGARETVDSITGAGGAAVASVTDVSVEEEVAAMVGTAVREFGGLHFIHNNAAPLDAAHKARDGTVVDMALEVWEKEFSVTLRGVMLGCKYAVPEIIRSGGGSVVNTGSNNSLVGDTTIFAYASAKGAVRSLSMMVATAYGKQGVRSNVISPGLIMTPAARTLVPQDLLKVFERDNLLPRLGEPEDVANLVLFLVSDESSFVTGQVFCVDGGQLAHLPHYSYLMEHQATTTKTAE